MAANALADRAEAAVARAATRCDFCQRAIVWTRTVNSTAMPVDAEPTDGGNVLVTHDAGGLRATVLGTPAKRESHRNAGWLLRVTHKLTCPFADEWSRPGGPKRGRQHRTPPATVRPGAGRGARR